MLWFCRFAIFPIFFFYLFLIITFRIDFTASRITQYICRSLLYNIQAVDMRVTSYQMKVIGVVYHLSSYLCLMSRVTRLHALNHHVISSISTVSSNTSRARRSSISSKVVKSSGNYFNQSTLKQARNRFLVL